MVRIRQIKDSRTTWGFSLIELLIVIVLIGLLSVIGFGYYQTYLMKGRDSQRKSDLQNIRSGLEMFRADQNTYPASVISAGKYLIAACDPSSCLTATQCNWNSIWSCGTTGSVYMQKLPKDPRSGTTPYDYHYTLNGSTYTLEACLENANDPDWTTPGSAWGTSCISGKIYQLTNP